MVDVEHTEHSYYISRYPAGREATVFEGAIDLKFRNDGPTPVRIHTQWSPSSIIVELVGQKFYDVTSTSSPRTSPVPHATRTIRPGQNCKPSSGVDGSPSPTPAPCVTCATGRSAPSRGPCATTPNPTSAAAETALLPGQTKSVHPSTPTRASASTPPPGPSLPTVTPRPQT